MTTLLLERGSAELGRDKNTLNVKITVPFTWNIFGSQGKTTEDFFFWNVGE